MNRKILKLWVHYRRNAPLVQTLVVVVGIFAIFQNCGRTYSPKTPSPETTAPGGIPSVPGSSTSSNVMSFPISSGANDAPLFSPGHPFGLALHTDGSLAIAAFQGPLVTCPVSSGACTPLVSSGRTPAGVSVAVPNPIGVTILPDARVAYIDYDDRSLHVQVRDPLKKELSWKVTPLGIIPYGIASNSSGSRIYITAERSEGMICSLVDASTETSTGVRCQPSKELTGFDVAVSAAGLVHVANSTSLNICQEDLSRCTVYSFPDGRTMAVGVAVGSSIFISDYFNSRVLKCSLSRSGIACADFVRDLNVPRTIRLDAKENLYVAEYGANQVSRFDPKGEPLN